MSPWMKKESILLNVMIKKYVKQIIRKKAPFIEACYKVILGEKFILKLQEQYEEETQFFLMRGATGDIYIQFMLLNNVIREKKIKSYVIIGDSPKINEIRTLFDRNEFLIIGGYMAECLEKAYMLLGSEHLHMTILFPWINDLYFNRCRVRMIERFNFMDSYRWYVMGIRDELHFEKPHFVQMKPGKIEQKGIIKNKTVIIAPEANSVTTLPIEFWNEVIDVLNAKGYKVLINCQDIKGYHANNIFFAYNEGVPILEYAGTFIGIRSGLCDIVSTAKCKKIIIYPKKTKNINYSEHRSEIEFCGLREMGLVGTNDELIEIETSLVRNITQKDVEVEIEYDKELKSLKDKILKSLN